MAATHKLVLEIWVAAGKEKTISGWVAVHEQQVELPANHPDFCSLSVGMGAANFQLSTFKLGEKG